MRAVSLLVLCVVVCTGLSCSRQVKPPRIDVTVVFFGEGEPVSYECDEVSYMGTLSDGQPLYRCSIWGNPPPSGTFSTPGHYPI